ncbi:MAG TPA: DUF4252 domain-containing protein [Draconibacterium sp.]|nr:DUF4252 domain-containing protein [Draconibacterium sp.]
MKLLILILTIIINSLPSVAQQNPDLFNQLTEKYADKEGFSASLLTSDMFDLYLKKKNLEEASPVFDALKNLDKIIVISQNKIMANTVVSGISDNTIPESNQLQEFILGFYKKNNYSLFKTEKRMGEDVKVYINKKQDKIVSLALVTNSSSSTNLVELQGNVDLKTVSELNKALNLKGLENLYKLDNNSPYYGSAVGMAYSKERIDEMVARQREQYERQHNLTDEQREKIELQTQEMVQKQMQMAEKYREMAEKYQREPIFLSYPGDTNTVYYINGKKAKAKEIKEMDKEKIESIEVKKADKKDDKTTIRIKTK